MCRPARPVTRESATYGCPTLKGLCGAYTRLFKNVTHIGNAESEHAPAPDAFSSRDYPAFETATRSARGVSETRSGRKTCSVMRGCHFALKSRVSRSVSLIRRVMPRGRVRAKGHFPRQDASNRQSRVQSRPMLFLRPITTRINAVHNLVANEEAKNGDIDPVFNGTITSFYN